MLLSHVMGGISNSIICLEGYLTCSTQLAVTGDLMTQFVVLRVDLLNLMTVLNVDISGIAQFSFHIYGNILKYNLILTCT